MVLLTDTGFDPLKELFGWTVESFPKIDAFPSEVLSRLETNTDSGLLNKEIDTLDIAFEVMKQKGYSLWTAMDIVCERTYDSPFPETNNPGLTELKLPKILC